MNNFKLIKIISAIIFISSISSCSKKEDLAEITGKWKVVSFEDYETSTIITKTKKNTWYDYNNGDIIINFNNSNNSKGNLSGKIVSNSLSAKYKIDKFHNIEIRSNFTTFAGQPKWADIFCDYIKSVEKYEIKKGSLIIYCNNNKNSITMERVNK